VLKAILCFPIGLLTLLDRPALLLQISRSPGDVDPPTTALRGFVPNTYDAELEIMRLVVAPSPVT